MLFSPFRAQLICGFRLVKAVQFAGPPGARQVVKRLTQLM